MLDPDLEIRGGGGYPDPEIRRGGAIPKKIFLALRASVLSTNKGGPLPYKCRSATVLWTSCEKHIFTPGYDKNAL